MRRKKLSCVRLFVKILNKTGTHSGRIGADDAIRTCNCLSSVYKEVTVYGIEYPGCPWDDIAHVKRSKAFFKSVKEAGLVMIVVRLGY